MIVSDATRKAPATETLWRFIASVGPGVVLLVSSIGPRDLIAGAAAGSHYGYGLLWTLLPIGLARLLLLEAIARYVIATGETLLAGYRRVGAWAAWTILGSIVLKRYLSNLYHVLLLGASAGMLIGSTGSLVTVPAAVAACVGAFVLMYGGYQGVEKWSKPLAALLGGSLALVAALSRPDIGELARGLLTPAIPEAEGNLGPMLVVLILVGSGLGALSSLKYSAFVFEKGWRDRTFLRRQRFDLAVSVAGGLAITVLIQVAAAALGPDGGQIDSFEALVAMFTETLGDTGRIALCVGLWATVFTTYIGSNTGYSLLAADLIVRPQGQDSVEDALAAANKRGRPVQASVAGEDGSDSAFDQRRKKVYRAFLIAFCLPPMGVLLTEWKPVPVVLLSSALSSVTVPIVVVILFLLTRNRKIMGDLANGFWANLALAGIVVLSIMITWFAVLELAERIF